MRFLLLLLTLVSSFPLYAHAQSKMNELTFRELLNSQLTNQNLAIDTSQLTYSSDTISANAALDDLTQIDSFFAKLSPLALYSAGKRSFGVNNNEKIIAPQLSAAQPITLVIVPGIFGEFIDTRAFEELFARAKDSGLNKRWFERLKNLPNCRLHSDIQCDQTTSLADLTLQPQSSDAKLSELKELLSISSIDNEQGQPLIELVLFNTPLLSLESLGDIKSRAATFNRRLEKYFSLMGTPKNIVFIGYSRGTMIGLEMLSQSLVRPWLQNVHSFVALGGVIYGSHLADHAFNIHNLNPEPKLTQQMHLIEKLLSTLKLEDDETLKSDGFLNPFTQGAERLVRRWHNTKAWHQFLSAYAQSEGVVLTDTQSLNNFFSKLQQDQQSTDPSAIQGLVMNFAVKFGLLPGAPNDFKTWLTAPYNLISKDYSLNIKRFRILVNSALTAAKELTTPARVEWWQTHSLPIQDIHYYSLAATLTEPESHSEESLLAKSQISYNPTSADYKLLIQNYRDFIKASGFLLNDSQVAVHRATFWPQLNAKLNSNNAGMQTTSLAVFGAHHWSLALRQVNKNKDGSMDKFPREALIKALAIALSSEFQ